MFKVGDVIKCVREGNIGWEEDDDDFNSNPMEIGEKGTVGDLDYSDDCFDDSDYDMVYIKEESWWYHVDHFKELQVKISNKERIAARRKQHGSV